VFDPSANRWIPTGDMTAGRANHVGARLADGRVLVTGGEHEECDPTGEMCDIIPSTAAEIFTP
jgi:hypothetical protein